MRHGCIKRIKTRQEKMLCVTSIPFSISTPLDSNNENNVGVNFSAATNLFKPNIKNGVLIDIPQGLRKRWRKKSRDVRQGPSKKDKQR